MLHQQLSDSNAAVSALKNQIKEMKEMNEAELDVLRANESRLQSLLKSSQIERQNPEVSKRESPAQKGMTGDFLSLQDKNAALVEELARCREDNAELLERLVEVRGKIGRIGKDNRHLRKVIVNFVEATRKSMQLAKQATDQSWELASGCSERWQVVRVGLAGLKNQIQQIKTYHQHIQLTPNFRIFRARLARKFAEVLAKSQRKAQAAFVLRERKAADKTALIADRLNEITTGLSLMAVSTSSSFALFVRFWEKTLGELKSACAHFTMCHGARFDEQRQKLQKKVKARDQEIRRLTDEIASVRAARDLAREKVRILSIASPPTKRRPRPAKPSVSTTDGLSQIKTVDRVDAATQSGLINMTLIRDRTIRHSKEAELSVIQGELDRTKEQNKKLLEQMGGLRRIVRRAGESATDESGKVRQTIEDLETQLREDKRLLQRKSSVCLKLQRDNEELAHAASKVEPLKKCLVNLFKTFEERLEPLIAEQAIPEDLSELDELAQELFQVPIHKICNPVVSKGFLKKQERRLFAALTEGIEVQEIESVFEAVIDELQKRAKGKADRAS
jgi:hypothetical protein